jgi:hypothetical protein
MEYNKQLIYRFTISILASGVTTLLVRIKNPAAANLIVVFFSSFLFVIFFASAVSSFRAYYLRSENKTQAVATLILGSLFILFSLITCAMFLFSLLHFKVF